MSTMTFYLEQAARQQRDADSATLDNVRDRCQRAADAWTILADRIQRTDALRASRETSSTPGVVVEHAG